LNTYRLLELYNKNICIREIAAELNVTYYAVYTWLRKQGFTTERTRVPRPPAMSKAEFLAKRKVKRNTPEGRATNREHLRKQRAKIRHAALAVLGDKCVRCGFTDKRALQIDHIRGGGNKERREGGKTQIQLYRWIVANVPSAKAKFQILCANHNWIKRFENKEFAYYGRPESNIVEIRNTAQ
jgi:hypothetical protein